VIEEILDVGKPQYILKSFAAIILMQIPEHRT
jgi:hypothetical protein